MDATLSFDLIEPLNTLRTRQMKKWNQKTTQSQSLNQKTFADFTKTGNTNKQKNVGLNEKLFWAFILGLFFW